MAKIIQVIVLGSPVSFAHPFPISTLIVVEIPPNLMNPRG